jgi:hypothetical protein
MNTRSYKLLAWLSVTLPTVVLALLLGLWEQSNSTLDRLLNVVGRYTWSVQPKNTVGTAKFLPPPNQSLKTLRSWEGVTRVALQTSLTKPLGQARSYTSAAVSSQWYALKNIKLQKGRLPQKNNEVVAGSQISNLLGQALPFGGGNFGAKYVVVGVLEPIPALRQLEDGSYNAALLRAIEYDTSIFANPEKILLETTPQAFMGTQKKLNDWLLAQDINTHFEVVRLADQYGLALREKTVRLLGGALFFGVLAVFIAALTNLMGSFWLERSSASVRLAFVVLWVPAAAKSCAKNCGKPCPWWVWACSRGFHWRFCWLGFWGSIWVYRSCPESGHCWELCWA